MLDSELIISTLCEQGVFIYDSFLKVEDYNALTKLSLELQQKGAFKRAKIGLNTKAVQNEAIRRDVICWLDNSHENPALRAYLSAVDDLMALFNRALFLSLAQYEAHFAVYSPGSFYKKHVDQFGAQKTRKISCVYYLNSDWKNNFGGALRIYSSKNKPTHTIYPYPNRLVCFNSELLHEVTVTQRTRNSIAGWMKTCSLPL